MKEYKVAIIIPTLNEERFIAKCIESVINQSFPLEEMDILVVDGGSIDKTREIVFELGRRYTNIRLLDNPGRIQSIAFNIGVHNSIAPYVIRLDAHAIYDKRYIELCVQHLSAHADYGNVGGVLNIQSQNSSCQAEANAILNKVPFGIGGAAFRVGTKAQFVDTVPFGAFPRRVLEKVGGMREDLPRGEDNEFNSRIRKFGYKIYLDPSIVCTYYARATIKESVRQMYANGKSIGVLLFVDRNSIGVRHLVPAVFVLVVVGLLLAGGVYHSFWYMLTVIIGFYFVAAFIATLIACHKYGYKYIGILPILFFMVHCSYGWGTMIGTIRKNK